MSEKSWYGVKLIYQLTGFAESAFEERVVIVRASQFDEAIARAEAMSFDYESTEVVYLGYAMACHIADESGPSLGEGAEVFSLIRTSNLSPERYLDHFHDTGAERARHA